MGRDLLLQPPFIIFVETALIVVDEDGGRYAHCVAKQKPFPDSVSRRHDSTCGVMLTNARLPGMSNQNSFRKLFIIHLPSSDLFGCAHEVAKPHIIEVS